MINEVDKRSSGKSRYRGEKTAISFRILNVCQILVQIKREVIHIRFPFLNECDIYISFGTLFYKKICYFIGVKLNVKILQWKNLHLKENAEKV